MEGERAIEMKMVDEGRRWKWRWRKQKRARERTGRWAVERQAS
jgi:hypothetical protein